MLFCKNLEETPSPRRGGISTTMPDKSTSSKPLPSAASGGQETATVAATETPAKPVKIYPIVKYGDPILEKPGAPIKKFDAELEQLVEDMFASMYAAQGVGLAAPQIGSSLRLTVIDVTGGKNPEAKIILANPEIVHLNGVLFLQHLSMLKRDLIKRKIKKLRKQGEW